MHLEVDDWGGDGPPTLLAHATGFNGRAWEPVAKRLVGAGRRVWSFDFRGHGRSDRSPDLSYPWDDFFADALTVTDRLGLGGDPDLLVAGHSMGGAALLGAEITRPGTYARIWAYEPIVFPLDEGGVAPADHPMSVGARRRRDVWDSPEEALAAYAAKPPLGVLGEDALRGYVDGGLRRRPDGRYELACRPEDEARIYTTGSASGIYPRLGEVRCPVRIVCGDPDGSPPSTIAAPVVARLPRGELIRADGLGHFGPFQDPGAMVASMLELAATI